MTSRGNRGPDAQGDGAPEPRRDTPPDPFTEPVDWDRHYNDGHTPWDMGRPSPPLEALCAEGALPGGRRVLVPGCGSGYEVGFLAQRGYDAVGVDLAELAVTRARRVVAEMLAESAEPGTARIVQADLLRDAPAQDKQRAGRDAGEHRPGPGAAGVGREAPASDGADLRLPGGFDWLFDQTFFCAIPPQRRRDYARRAAALLVPGGEAWILAFATGYTNRPPYDTPPETVQAAFTPAGFTVVDVRRLDRESHPARRGREALVRLRRGR